MYFLVTKSIVATLFNDIYLDLGLRQPRLEGEEYLAVVDEFMEAVHARWPKAVVQFEL